MLARRGLFGPQIPVHPVAVAWVQAVVVIAPQQAVWATRRVTTRPTLDVAAAHCQVAQGTVVDSLSRGPVREDAAFDLQKAVGSRSRLHQPG